MRDFFTEETVKIRELVSRDPSYSELTDEKLREKIDIMLELRMNQCQTEDVEVAAYYSSISFRVRKSLADTVFESIRGLGILGKIIADKSITEVMINGYDATLKAIKKEATGLWVLPHNPNSDFKPTFFTNKEVEELPVRILGVAVEIRRSL